jgi:indolepyruvate decarboxylase
MTATVSDYLLQRLRSLGVDHVFGIPGDYILPFFQRIASNGVTHVAACNELNAGYAADGYARLRGLGAVAVTYGPGSLSVVNAAAGALAESVPVLFISGGPSLDAYRTMPAMHHLLPGNFDASLRIFEQVTAHARRLDDPERATAEIDQALSVCLSQQKPVYLEIPQDVQTFPSDPPEQREFRRGIHSDPDEVARAVTFLAGRISAGRRTVILPGHEIHRARIENAVTELIEKAALPFASMFIGKADFLEQHPNCIGAYQGAGSPAEVRQFVESADTVVFLGCVPSDFNLGGFTAQLSEGQIVRVLDNQVAAGKQLFDRVSIGDLVNGLLAALPSGAGKAAGAPVQAFLHTARNRYEPDPDQPISNRRFYDRIAHFLQAGDIVLADAGCAINSTHMQLPANTQFIASCYWASIGMAFGATLGACMAAKPGQRIIALEGDGSFQMTAQELSSMVRYDKTPIVFVVNNLGYTAERLIHDGDFNDIAQWKYHLLPVAFGGIKGEDVWTEGDLETALEIARGHQGPGPLVVEVHLDPWDASEAFRLMSEALRSR